MWLLFLACGGTPQAASPAPPPTPTAEPRSAHRDKAKLRKHMHEHLAKARVSYEALIHGDLPAARAALTWLHEHEPPPQLPPTAEPFLDRMRALAGQGAVAPMYVEVAARISDVAVACGECHQAHKVSPRIDYGVAPSPSQEIYAHMARHQWAVDAMWAGLVLPSDAAWSAGLKGLSDEHLADERFEVPELSDEAQAQARAAHELARKAVVADSAARAKTFGSITTACAGCHSEMRGE